ncbi:MAG: hypothetical protein KJZ77_04795 [Anaerolineales bacterium]|jgi:hypothetical protein|nr:hypothetical protein [Anaerolineales bacterium]
MTADPAIRFVYLYRDASNYKQHGEVIFPNEIPLTVEEVDKQIRSFLSDGLFFIARQVGVEERFFDVVNKDDHPWHEYVSVEATTDPTFDPVPGQKRDIAQFLKELEQAHRAGWDEQQVREDLIQQIEKERQALKRWLASRGGRY